jgi:geranylgeranyl reductase family protein
MNVKFLTSIATDCDIMIIGAGPAGASCATYLANDGFKVILVDWQKFPRDKVCGDFVSPFAINELTKLGVSHLDAFKKTNIIRSAAIFINGEERINRRFPKTAEYPEFGRVIPRIILDDMILQAARKAGVKIIESARFNSFQVFENAVVSYMKQGDKDIILSSKMLIGADGSQSSVARILRNGKPDEEDLIIGVRAYFENINSPEDRADLYFSSETFPGYYWLFPTGNGGANVGVGMLYKTLPRNNRHLKELLLQLISEDTCLKSRIGDGKLQGKVAAWPLSTYNPNSVYSAERVLLIGDAAGLINPLNGEGIQYALQTGRWAAEIIKQSNEDYSNQALYAFKRKLDESLSYDLSFSNWIVQFIRNRTFNPVWIKVLEVFINQAKINDAYGDIAGGIIAGIFPASKALAPDFIFQTFQQGFKTFGQELIEIILKKNILKSTFDAGSFSIEIVKNIVNEPAEFFSWVKTIIGSSVELSRNHFNHK